MNDQWFYTQNGQQLGPVDLSTLGQLLAEKQVRSSDLVWCKGFAHWKAAYDVPELARFIENQSGTLSYQSSLFFDYAPFWYRFAATFIDSMLIYLLLSGVEYAIKLTVDNNFSKIEEEAIEEIKAIFFLLVYWVYYGLMESGSWQATIGKRILGIYVTNVRGERITFARASGQYFASILSSLLLYIGYLIQPFTAKKQALHDMLAGTLVLRGKIG